MNSKNNNQFHTLSMRDEDNKITYIATTLPPSNVLLFLGACRGRVEGCFLGRGCGVVAAGFGVFGWFGLEGVFVLGVFAGLVEGGEGEGAGCCCCGGDGREEAGSCD